LVFLDQPWRRFVLGLSVVKQQMRVHFYDRSGCSISPPFDIHSNPHTLVAILTAVMFGPRQCVGFDPIVNVWLILPLQVSRRKVIYNSTCANVPDSVPEELEDRRGTVVYHARRLGQMYIIKDHWVENPSQEKRMMDLVKGIPSVPTLIDHWEVEIFPSVVDTTSRYRSEKSLPFMKGKRTHVRAVMSPCGRPLTKFRSKRELVTGIRDILVGKCGL
ncbi:hypothetical protein EDD15DRAFT_2107761, partial [Pisolithus albus]